MKFLRILSFTMLFIILIILVLGNIFYNDLRKYFNKSYLELELSDELINSFEKVTKKNADYLIYAQTEKKVYSNFDKIIIIARLLRKSDLQIPVNAKIEARFFTKDGKKINNLDGRDFISLTYDHSSRVWKGALFPADTSYKGEVILEITAYPDSPEAPIATTYIFYLDTTPQTFSIQKGICFLGIYSLERISKRNIISLDGKEVSWDYLPEWLNILSSDGILMLSGITKTFQEETTLSSCWDKDKINESDILADKLNKNGKKFGAWVKALKVEGSYLKKIGYKPSISIQNGKIEESIDFISLKDENRKKSLARLLSTMMQNENYSFVGLSDLIPPENSGIELYEEFLKDIQLPVPENWENLDENQKISTFSQKLSDKNILSTFENWKKYFVYSYLQQLIDSIGHKKPIFYFIDYSEIKKTPELIPLLFNAGIDFIVINFNIPYNQLSQESEELKNRKIFEDYGERIVISYNLDYKHLDIEKSKLSAIENYLNSYQSLIKELSKTHNISGIVVNDLYNAMSGKRGPYSPLDWMYGIGRIIYVTKQLYSNIPLEIYYQLPFEINYGKENQFGFHLANISENSLRNVKLELLNSDGKKIFQSDTISEISPGDFKELKFNVTIPQENQIFIKKKQVMGMRITWKDTNNRSFLTFITFRIASLEEKSSQ